MNKHLSQFEKVDTKYGFYGKQPWYLDRAPKTDVDKWRRSLPPGQTLREQLVPRYGPLTSAERLR